MAYRPVTLVVLKTGADTERLFAHLQRELAEEARVTATELPTVKGTTVAVEFTDARSHHRALAQVRQVLDATNEGWGQIFEFTTTTPIGG